MILSSLKLSANGCSFIFITNDPLKGICGFEVALCEFICLLLQILPNMITSRHSTTTVAVHATAMIVLLLLDCVQLG